MTDIKLHEKVERMTQRIINGLVVKYDPEVHIKILFEHFLQGRDIAAFCSDAEIGRSTFYTWIDGHPEFARAYEVAREAARIWWESQIDENNGLAEIDGVKFNTKLWTTIMKNRFEMTDQRKLTLPKLKNAKNFAEQIKILADYASDGNLTSSEASQLSGLILAAIKVEESTIVKEKIEKLEAFMESQK